jgi:hypothetical protein
MGRKGNKTKRASTDVEALIKEAKKIYFMRVT